MAPTETTKDDCKLKSTRIKEKTIAKQNTKENKPILIEHLHIQCPICLENINKDNLSSTKCGHVFCTICLRKAMKRKAVCPTCRMVLRGRGGYHPLYLQTCPDIEEVK